MLVTTQSAITPLLNVIIVIAMGDDYRFQVFRA